MANPSQHRCVFVGNIPYDASEEQLIQICEEVGPVVSFRLVIDRETGKPKGYGFCEYKDEETALSARRNLQGYEINGRQLRVDFAENDKGADKGREQGRGGPGLTSNADPQKSSGGPAILGDAALFQPVGLPLCSTAASVMAGALGGVQTDSMSLKQNGLQSQSGFANDPLTLYLATMSRKQLYDIMAEMKVMATQNKELARQLLSLCPLLPKALFQAQIMLGMVTPQVLQMSNIRQPPSSLPQPALQDGSQDAKVAGIPPHPGQSSLPQKNMQHVMMTGLHEGQGSAMPHTSFVSTQPSTVPFLQSSSQPRFQHPQQAQNQTFLQTTVPSQPGASMVSSLRPVSGLPQPPAMESSIALKQQMQAALPNNQRPAAHSAQLGFPISAHHSVPPRPLSSQPNFQPGSSSSMAPSGLPEVVINKQGAPNGTTWASGMGKREPTTSMTGKPFEPTHRPSKLARLEDGRSTSTDMMPKSDNPVSQLAPDVQSALLEQVKSLTPEQLSSLPPEQRQQVIDLQRMLLQ